MLVALAAAPVLISVLLGLLAGPIGRRLPPATAVLVLAPASLATALATGFCLAVLAFNGIARIHIVAALGHWSVIPDPDDGTPPPLIGVVLALIATGLLTTGLRQLWRSLSEAVRTVADCRGLPMNADRIVVLDDEVADAFAVPGLRGRIVITSAMLAALEPSERAVLVAHERSHLAHRHHVLVQLTRLAASADPLLLPAARQVRILTERWADEDAAAAVRDRNLAARAVAKAALARTSTTRAATGQGAARRAGDLRPATLGAAATAMTLRVEALTRPRAAAQPRLAGAVAGLVLVGLLSSAWLAHTTEDRFEHGTARLGPVVAGTHLHR